MKIVEDHECRGWLSGKLGSPFDWTTASDFYACKVTYLLSADAGRKTALARALSHLLDSSGMGLLWITEWGVFPSSENMALFDGYRRSLGDDRPLHAAPGHLFDAHERKEVECLIGLALYFFWDASIFDAGSIWLELSHDEVFSVSARDDAALRSCEKVLSPFELKELSRTSC